LFGCKISSNKGSSYSENGASKMNCFEDIKDTLTKLDCYDQLLKSSSYNRINKNVLFKLVQSENNNYKEQISNFFEGSDNVETYLLGNEENRSLILIGKALGATGIGVGYWNYQYYPLNKNEPVIEFSSIIKTPYSFYIDKKGAIKHIEIEDDYPRPANGEYIKLDYLPILIHVFNKKDKKLTIEFHCKN
jgi:hypothetical protein